VVAYDLDGACKSRAEGNKGVAWEGGVCRVAAPPRVVRYESIAVAFALHSLQPILESSEATGQRSVLSMINPDITEPYSTLIALLIWFPDNFCPRQQPSERYAHPYAPRDPLSFAISFTSDEVLRPSMNTVGPFVSCVFG